MSFPPTHHTLIRCLAAGTDDAKNIAAQVFEALPTHRLLNRSAADRPSKLRMLLCTVGRHVPGNCDRVDHGTLRKNASELIARNDFLTTKTLDAPDEQIDALPRWTPISANFATNVTCSMND